MAPAWSASAASAAIAWAQSLGRAAVEGGLLVLAIGLLVRLFPRMSAATRTALWWLAALRLVAGLIVWPAPVVHVPALPQASAAPQMARELARTSIAATPQLAPAGALFARLTSPPDRTTPQRTLAWSDVGRLGGPLGRAAAPGLIALWMLGVLAVLALHLVAARRAHLQWKGATAFDRAAVREWLTSWLGARGAARVELRVSAEASAPALLAGPRPRILLPQSCATLPQARLRMVLAHEVAHLRRHDLAFGTLPAIAHALFWFHPFAHWAVDEYAQCREEACDADAVRACDAPTHDYGELLLAYGIARHPVRGAAVSYGSRCASQLHRRLLMLASNTRITRTQRLLGLAVLVAVALVALRPVRLVAGTSRTTAAVAAEADRNSSTVVRTASRPSRDSFAYGYGYRENGDADHLNVSGSFEEGELNALRTLGRENPHGFAWFRLDDAEYLVTDAAAMTRVRELMAPQEELGRRQGELGERQGELGARQGELGERMGELGERMGKLGERLASLSAALGGERLSEARRAALQSQIDAIEQESRDIEAKQDELSKKQDELGARQDELGARQDALGAQQDALSARVDAEMRKLVAEWIRTGVAVRVEHR